MVEAKDAVIMATDVLSATNATKEIASSLSRANDLALQGMCARFEYVV